MQTEDEEPRQAVSDADYARLAQLREGIRRYLAWAEERAREHSMTPAQVQLALAIRAHADPNGPTVKELAETLLLRHHSVVGLVDRATQAGFVERARDPERPGHVRVRLTAAGAERLERLSALHVAWLSEHAGGIASALRAFEREGG